MHFQGEPDYKRAIIQLFERPNICLLVFLIGIIGIFTFKDYLLFKKLYVFLDIGSDSYVQAYPHFVNISDHIRNEGMPSWSFFHGMGQNIFPGEINNPFNLILYLLGREFLPYGIAYVELLKMFLGGIIFYYYLKTLSLSPYTRVIGGILFAFSGYMVLGSGWYVHSTFIVFGALLLLSFEKVFKNNSWFLFPLSVALICSRSVFYLYILGVFLIFYSFFRMLNEGGYNAKKICVLYGKLALLGLLGIAMVAPFIANDLLRILESPRIGGEAGYFSQLMSGPIFSFGDYEHNITAVLRLFSNDILGVGSDFRGWSNYLEAPNFYCGLSSLVLFPQIFWCLKRKEKIVFAAFMMIWVLIVVFPFLRYALYLFTGNYYKGGVSFIIPVVLLFYSLHALDFIERNRRINVVILFSTLGVLLGLLYFPYFPHGKSPVVNETRLIATTFLVIYGVILFFIARDGSGRALRYSLVVVVCIEAYMFSFITCNSRMVLTAENLKQPIGYNDGTVKVLEHIKSKDSEFYRVNKDYSSGIAIHKGLNDSLIQGYYGTPSYQQFNQKYYIRFLVETGVIDGNNELMTRWAPGLLSRPLLQTLTSVKYHLIKRELSDFEKASYRPFVRYNDVLALQNECFLPLGFTYDRFLSHSEFIKLDPKQKDVVLLKAFVAEDGEEWITHFEALNINNLKDKYALMEYKEDVNRLRQETMLLTSQSHSQNEIKGTIEVEGRKLLFFSIPYDKGWSIYVDEIEIEPILINIGFMGVIIDKGAHSIELKYTPPFLLTGTIIMIVSMMFYVFLVIRSLRKKISIGH